MDDGQNMFFDFILERTPDENREAMVEFLQEAFKPPEDGSFDPEAFQRNTEIIMSMLTPEGAEEFQQMMANPFGGDDEELDEELLHKNWLGQPNRDKWREDTSEASVEEIRFAYACARDACDMECDCWNTGCVYFGDCRKCIVFHLCLKQFPTCQRSLLGDLEEHYIVFSRDK